MQTSDARKRAAENQRPVEDPTMRANGAGMNLESDHPRCCHQPGGRGLDLAGCDRCMTESGVVMKWQEPPRARTPKVLLVAEQLRQRPGVWALIAENEQTSIFPWWGRLYDASNPDFEVKFDRKDGHLFGVRDIYARYVGKASS